MTPLTDTALWQNAANGDPHAFGVLFDRHSRRIYNYLFRRCGDWAAAEDMLSIVFLETWRKRRSVTLMHDSVLPFLYGVATNVLRNHRRAQWRYRLALQRVPVAAEASLDEDEIVDRLSDQARMGDILAVFSQLPKREQDVLSLCGWMGLSYEQAAEALGLPIGTVRSRLSRGRARLRELLGDSGHEESVTAKVQAEQEGLS